MGILSAVCLPNLNVVLRPSTFAGLGCHRISPSFFMRRKILLVEDNKELLQLLRLSFKNAGYATATASDGLDAVKKARSWLPDLIVLDLVLPQLDGFAVCELLRKDPTTASTPVLMLSGIPGQLSRYAGLESGGTDFITKPANPTDVIARAGKLLCDAEVKQDLPQAVSAPPFPRPRTVL